MGLKDLVIPDIGNYKGVDVIEINVKIGESIQKDQTLLTLETDKATMEIPAPEAGVVKELLCKVGDKVSMGTPVVRIEATSSASPSSPTVLSAPSAPSTPPVASVQASSTPTEESSYVHAGPAVRQLARELGLDSTHLKGTGLKGRIIRQDVTAYAKSALSSKGGEGSLGLLPDPVVDFSEFGGVRIEKLPRIKKISGAALTRNAIRIPHITLFDSADITDLEAFRLRKKGQAERLGLKLTPLPFLVKAVASALKNAPIINASLSSDGESLIFKEYVHVGVAVDTPLGLMVPVIRNADQKGLMEITKELSELSTRAREGKLKPEEMKGGCFTLSSLGGIGTTAFTPIVNMPEVGILGISRAETQPKWDGNAFQPRLMLPLSLSLDHRVVDGAEGARFLSQVLQNLTDLREMLL